MTELVKNTFATIDDSLSIIINNVESMIVSIEAMTLDKDKSVESGAFLNMFKAQGQNPVVEIECDHEGLFTNPKAYTEGLIQCIEI